MTLAQSLMEKEAALSPMIAVNPLHQHPLSLAKKIATLSALYPNELALNLISGSFFREHRALGDGEDFAGKSERLKEFFLSLRSMLEATAPVHRESSRYPLHGLELSPKVKKNSIRYFVSGPALPELTAFEDTWFVKSLRPVTETEELPPRSGFLLGICARKSREEARKAARELFPEDEFGKRMHEMSSLNDMSPWNKFIKDYGQKHPDDDHFYLKPLQNFWSPAPYIVGSYEEVADVLKKYEALGAAFFITDFHPGDLSHVEKVISSFR